MTLLVENLTQAFVENLTQAFAEEAFSAVFGLRES
jgi:hypothetical protein